MNKSPETSFSPDIFQPKDFLNWRENLSQEVEALVALLYENERSVSLSRQVSHLKNENIGLLIENDPGFGKARIDESLQQYLTISLESTRTTTRKSGEPYVVHPIRVAATIFSQADDISIESRKKSVAAALLHDSIEESQRLRDFAQENRKICEESPIRYQRQHVGEIAAEFRSITDRLGDKRMAAQIITLMEPVISAQWQKELQDSGCDDYLILYGAFAEQLQMQAEGVEINTEIADRIEDIVDLGNILGNSQYSVERQKIKLKNKLAKCKFTLDYICWDKDGRLKDGVSMKLLTTFQLLWQTKVSEMVQIGMVSREEITERISEFTHFVQVNNYQLHQEINRYEKQVTE